MQNELIVKSKDDIIRFVDQNPTKKRTLLLILIALGGIFLDAYDLTILGTATDQLTSEFNLSPFALSSIMTIMPIGALIGALIGGVFTDRFGRKLMFLIDLILLALSAAGAALAPNPEWLFVFRFLMGLGIGLDMPIALSFIAEFSNSKTRGRNVNYWQVFWYIATVSSTLIVMGLYALNTGDSLWRWSVGFGAVIAVIVLVLRLIFLGESPMWAAKNLSLKEAAKVLENTYNVSVKLEQQPGLVQEKRNKEIEKSLLKVIFNKKYRPRTILASVIAATQGMEYYAVGLYIPLIAVFVVGEGKLESLTGTALINVAGIIGAFVGAQLTIKYGTRKIAIFGYLIVLLSMVLIGIVYGNGISMWLTVALISLFIFGHSAGPGPQGKTIGTLSYPTILRGYGTGFVEASSRVGGMIGTFAFPIILNAVGLAGTMLILTFAPIVGLITSLIIKWDPVGKDIEQEEEEIVQYLEDQKASV
ncbi:MFS transporter [Lentibacillus sp. N15]|uniref:MFS transporter n=1 Tax=Lentibacillus songyuanensis TaxID=3136161 RepID=UPI0031B9EB8D